MREQTQEVMEENPTNGSGGEGVQWWWWALASTAQLGWATFSCRKGYAGDARFLPFKAFAVASIFVGSAATASVAGVRASGIYKVEDVMQVGKSVRAGIGLPPRAQKD